MDKIVQGMHYRTLSMLARIREARVLLSHEGLYGSNNEALLIETLREYLGNGWDIGSGEIVDADGNSSPQCDVIIYDGVNFPPLYRNRLGSVVVMAHSVGAVVEVKSRLVSGVTVKNDGDVQKLCNQLIVISSFLDAALRRPMSPEVSKLYIGKTIPVFGLAYEADCSLAKIEEAVDSTAVLLNKRIDFFILDLARSANDLKEQHDKIVTKISKEKLEEYYQWMTTANSYSISSHFFMTGPVTTWRTVSNALGMHGLRTLVKEISDKVRTLSPLSVPHSPYSAEKIYTEYNSWRGIYEDV